MPAGLWAACHSAGRRGLHSAEKLGRSAWPAARAASLTGSDTGSLPASVPGAAAAQSQRHSGPGAVAAPDSRFTGFGRRLGLSVDFQFPGLRVPRVPPLPVSFRSSVMLPIVPSRRPTFKLTCAIRLAVHCHCRHGSGNYRSQFLCGQFGEACSLARARRDNRAQPMRAHYIYASDHEGGWPPCWCVRSWRPKALEFATGELTHIAPHRRPQRRPLAFDGQCPDARQAWQL